MCVLRNATTTAITATATNNNGDYDNAVDADDVVVVVDDSGLHLVRMSCPVLSTGTGNYAPFSLHFHSQNIADALSRVTYRNALQSLYSCQYNSSLIKLLS